jgi:hypothetical protein
MIRRAVTALFMLAACGLMPAAARAQAVGIGPRFSFVRGDLTTNAPATRFVGGTLRMVSSPHTVFEVALDYRAFYNAAGTERTRETPIQASMLLFPARGVFAPYVGGGIGFYTQLRDTLGPAGGAIETTKERKTGWHLGLGAELRVAKHASLFADYRFRFVKFGASTDPGAENIPTGGIPGLSQLHLSHQGSMWTSGMAFYF